MPPETEATHFTAVMSRYAGLHGMTLEQFCDEYNSGALHVPDLDLYFAHDRSLREVRTHATHPQTGRHGAS